WPSFPHPLSSLPPGEATIATQPAGMMHDDPAGATRLGWYIGNCCFRWDQDTGGAFLRADVRVQGGTPTLHRSSRRGGVGAVRKFWSSSRLLNLAVATSTALIEPRWRRPSLSSPPRARA